MRLVWVLRYRGEALEADLARYYQLDLADMWRGRLSVRRVSVLVHHLPPGCAVRSTGFDDYDWDGVTQEVVNLHDQLRRAINKNSPELPRPGDQAKMRSAEDRIFAKAARYRERRQQLGR